MPDIIGSDDPSFAERLRARHALWRRGNLSWLFSERPWQKGMYEFVRAGMGDSSITYSMISAHRRSGKSSLGLIVGMEEALRAAGTDVAVVCKAKEQARGICDSILPELLKDCPRQLAPRRIKNDFAYVFDHNGSKLIILAADRLSPTYSRGRKFRFVFITEAAFIPNLKRLIASVFAPTLRDVTGKWHGSMLLESTPPDETVDEDTIQEYIEMWKAAELENRAFMLDIDANKWASPEFVKQAELDSGGRDSVIFRREYKCEFILAEDASAVPEFTLERAFHGNPDAGVPPIVREVPRALRGDRYCSMDVGGSLDLWGLLWGWYWFEKDALVIEDEALLSNAIGLDIAKQISYRESELWPGIPGGKLFRIADGSNSVLLQDLLRVHGLRFVPTQKDHKDAQLNLVRTMIREGRIVIHPRCKLLIKTLRLARRAPTGRRSFQRTQDIGHADLLDSLLYMCRNIHRHEMPEEVRPPALTRDILPPPKPHATSGEKLRDLLVRMRNQRLRSLVR
jgi:hypothetical protein